MHIKRRFLSRKHWKRVISAKNSIFLTDGEPAFRLLGINRAAVGIFRIEKVSEPLRVRIGDKIAVAADKGFTWIGLLPEDSHWSMTAMLDPEERVVQYYFDITLSNHLGDNPYFDDLFLDLSISPGRSVYMLDSDELEEALRDKLVTDEDAENAYAAVNDLMSRLSGKAPSSVPRGKHYIRLGSISEEAARTLENMLRGFLKREKSLQKGSESD